MSKHVNLAYYRERDWDRLLSIVYDRESMHNTWHEWHQSFNKTKKELKLTGLTVNEFEVNLDELIKYCFENGMLIDGKARSQFVANR